jgi:hypothetical protein
MQSYRFLIFGEAIECRQQKLSFGKVEPIGCTIGFVICEMVSLGVLID